EVMEANETRSDAWSSISWVRPSIIAAGRGCGYLMNINVSSEIGLRAGRKRDGIEGAAPERDAALSPIKRVTGESVVVEANVFADGHDSVASAVLYRNERE